MTSIYQEEPMMLCSTLLNLYVSPPTAELFVCRCTEESASGQFFALSAKMLCHMADTAYLASRRAPGRPPCLGSRPPNGL